MISLLLMASTALAWEGQPGLWLPDATPMGQSTGRAGLGVHWDGAGERAVLQGIVGATPKLAINAAGFIGNGAADVGVGFRYMVLSKQGFTLAPTAQFQIGQGDTDTYIGLAGSFFGDGATLDASLTLIGANTHDGTGSLVLPPHALRWFEAGVTFHPAKRQELRIGAINQDDFQLVATYRWRGDWWFVEPSVLWWPEDLAARLQAGVRF